MVPSRSIAAITTRSRLATATTAFLPPAFFLICSYTRRHAAPWVARRVRGVSSGDDLDPKRPELLPL